MVKRLMLIMVCALVVGLALPAFAEVQNIKVSGDLTFLGISRLNFDTDVNKPDAEESHGATIARIRLDADLTENVSAVIRLINERDWNRNTGDTAGNGEEISIDLASVTFREFFYSPLTVTLGRQELHFGNELIVGDPDTNNQETGTSLTDLDLSSKKAFDAIRATLDYNPLVIDLFWAKIDENTVLGTAAGTTSDNEKDDTDLFGVNARYDFGGNWNALGELYYFGKFDSDDALFTATGGQDKKEVINNIGVRAEISPKERLLLMGEVAYQFGKNVESDVLKDHQALAIQGVARYALDRKYDPVLMLIYSYFSGDVETGDDNSRGWDPMFENQTNGHIANVLLDQSNFHVLNLRGSMVPIDDLTLTMDYVWISFAQKYSSGTSVPIWGPDHSASSGITATGADYVGSEIDVALTYDYTEDVQIGLLAGWFMPGDAFDSGLTETVSELIASCKVSF